MKTRNLLLRGALATILAAEAAAQFPGDIYLATPSVTAQEGDVIEVEVLTFSGDLPVGAHHFSISFDSAVLTLAEPVDSVREDIRVGSRATEGRVGLVCSNSLGADEPFGVVSLAVVRFEVVGIAGSSSPLDLSSLGAVSLAGLSISSSAFDGSVSVVSGISEGETDGAMAPLILSSLDYRSDLLRGPARHDPSRFGPPGAFVSQYVLVSTPRGWGAVRREGQVLPAPWIRERDLVDQSEGQDTALDADRMPK